MNFNLTEPNPGDRISATLIREIVRAIRSLTPISGHGVKITQGPNGTVINATPGGTRGAKEDKGCFCIESFSVDANGKVDLTFGNRYVRFGGKTYVCEARTASAIPPYIAYVKVGITASSPNIYIETCGTLEALVNMEDLTDYYVFPLYELDEKGSVKCDFRNAPCASQWEFTEHTLPATDDSSGGTAS